MGCRISRLPPVCSYKSSAKREIPRFNPTPDVKSGESILTLETYCEQVVDDNPIFVAV